MLRFLTAPDLDRHPALAAGMFRDRAEQFSRRLGWAVSVDAEGFERDPYDACDPLYVIWQRPDGGHGGSMRFLPTTGPTMTQDHFAHLTDHTVIRSPFIWECTRFCLSADADAQTSAALMAGGLAVGLQFGLSHAIGVFDARMVRIYGRLGWTPAILGTDGAGRDAISAGLWDFDTAYLPALLRRAGFSSEVLSHWRTRAFGRAAALPRAA